MSSKLEQKESITKLHFPLSCRWTVLYRAFSFPSVSVRFHGGSPSAQEMRFWLLDPQSMTSPSPRALISMAYALFCCYALLSQGDDVYEFTLLHSHLSSPISTFSLKAVLAATTYSVPSAKFSNANGVAPVYRNILSLGPVHLSVGTHKLVVQLRLWLPLCECKSHTRIVKC